MASQQDETDQRQQSTGDPAIQFLRNWFAGSPELFFDDQPSHLPQEMSSFEAFVITTRPFVKTDVVLPLAGWAIASLRRCQLRKANLCESSLVGANFAESDLSGAVLTKVKANHANFSNCILSGIIAPDSCWPHANLLFANMDEAKLASADFGHAVLSNASLVRCDLSRADLRACDFHYGSTRCGLVDSPYPSHGTRTGFYTDDYNDRHYRKAEEIRKANMRGCDLRGAKIGGTDFYLVDLRDAKLDNSQRKQLAGSGAILD